MPSTVTTVHESEQADGGRLVAARDIHLPATDSLGRPVKVGTVFVAAAGQPIPSEYLADERVLADAVAASDYRPEPKPKTDAKAKGKGGGKGRGKSKAQADDEAPAADEQGGDEPSGD